MSPHERSAWIRLAVLLLVYAPYFAFVLDDFRHGDPLGRTLLLSLTGAAIAYTLLSIAAHAANRLAFGGEVVDERDALIDARSLRVAHDALVWLVMGALFTMAVLGLIEPPSPTGLILLPTFTVTSQFVFFCFVAAEALRHATQIVCYRMQAVAP